MLKTILSDLFFCYAAKATVSANDDSNQQITFSNDSDFLIQEIRNTTQTAGNILLSISLASGEQFSNIAIDSSLFSAGNNGLKFFRNIRVPANTQLNVNIQNTSGGSLTHEIQFWGYKIPKGHPDH